MGADELAAELRLAAEANRVLKKEIRELRAAVEIQRLREENATLAHGLSFKVAVKSRALSVYGLNAMPTSLYKEQWLRLLSAANDIKKFITENETALATRAESRDRPRPKLVRDRRRA